MLIFFTLTGNLDLGTKEKVLPQGTNKYQSSYHLPNKIEANVKFECKVFKQFDRQTMVKQYALDLSYQGH